ncbi:MAG: GGDEF domain-containing protein [Desulfatibacillaceae bacterium]
MLPHITQVRQRDKLREIIKGGKVSTVFQPVVDLRNGHIFAHEALSRFDTNGAFVGPEELFTAAQQWELTGPLEHLCLRTALATAGELGLDGRLSLNLCPSIFRQAENDDHGVEEIIRKIYQMRDRVIVELTERFLIRDDGRFRKTVDRYRRQGFRIAIDDLGSGYAGLKMLTQIEPYMVKIDRFLISGVDRSAKKQLLISSLVDFCHRINSMVVAEGIETEGELDTVMDLGVDLGQGYFLARPQSPPEDCSEEAMERIRLATANPGRQWQASNFVGALAQFVAPVSGKETVEQVVARFMREPDLAAIPVLEGNRPIGIVHKTRLFYRLGQRFGYDLFARKEVEHVVEKAMVHEAHTAIEDVSRKLLTREESEVYDAIIVVHNGGYLGITFVHHILEAITDQKINLAKQANPLTGLPGNNLIKQEIENRLSMSSLFAVMYFDLDNFKPFNDHFGFGQGDQVIRLVGNLLKDMVTNWDPLALIGHVGGDDFVVVCRSQGIGALCETILERFARQSGALYPDDVLDEGHYMSIDRKGRSKRYRLLSMSIAVVTTERRAYGGYAHLASVASEVKKKAKTISGNSYYVDQRQE